MSHQSCMTVKGMQLHAHLLQPPYLCGYDGNMRQDSFFGSGLLTMANVLPASVLLRACLGI